MMAYARKGADDSDVYVYSDGESFNCGNCSLSGEPPFNTASYGTREEMINHLDAHVSAGHEVPAYVFDRLHREIRGEKEPDGRVGWGGYPQWAWTEKPSLAVVASRGDEDGYVLWTGGPHIAYEIETGSPHLQDLSMGECPKGIWVWEGLYHALETPATPNGPEEYEVYPEGKFRAPTAEEWAAIQKNECPWSESDWGRNGSKS